MEEKNTQQYIDKLSCRINEAEASLEDLSRELDYLSSILSNCREILKDFCGQNVGKQQNETHNNTEK
jgi:hypothetical protein